MENLKLEVNNTGDISMNGKTILVCYNDCEKLSNEIANRVNEQPYLLKEIARLKNHIKTMEKSLNLMIK